MDVFRLCAWALSVATFLVGAGSAVAAPVTLNGITFSDELGGVVIHGGSGTGSTQDPFVLVEEITDEGPAILTVRGMESRIGREMGPQALAGFALVKVVTNSTRHDWNVFELELRQDLKKPSTYEDGLSFAQAQRDLSGFAADRYGRVRRNDEPLDAVEFDDGTVRRGEVVTVRMMVTDYTPTAEFFLLQRREGEVAGLVSRQAMAATSLQPVQ